jgi:hypothetical protein
MSPRGCLEHCRGIGLQVRVVHRLRLLHHRSRLLLSSFRLHSATAHDDDDAHTRTHSNEPQ